MSGNAYSSEISFTIASPQGTVVNLVNTGDYANDNPSVGRVQATFDDAAGATVSGNPATGTFQPVGSLSDLNGQEPFGDWSLTFADSTNDDGLILHGFTVEINATDPNNIPTNISLSSNDIDEGLSI